MEMRSRLAGDLDSCVVALRATHEADAYPLKRSGAAAFYRARGFAHTHDVAAGWSGPDGRPVTLRYYALG
ncbi:hypothetical protein [Actinoplanes awajinensis]|uniref:Uncharacterized protein n=1 Tax=Actinoplanes awajinensis subsp. mycoplanecinus TaxID=135947 RepID=A0A124GA43_9ACTN|nr:hypothetical protein [Actinoplanes awajinensis]KUL31000.1 hypothetical protein ADL15_23960 [Actinoplanes awajinensis subsp. mycoplanecinus]